MVMIKDRKGKEVFHLSEKYQRFLKRIDYKINNEDTDIVGIYGGDTGSGKSLRAMWDAYVIDPTISLDRVCFNKKEFINAIIKAKKGQAIIGDEAIGLFFSRSSMTKENRILIEMMAQIRQKNLCVLLCVPDVLTLDWTILNKASFYVHVWEKGIKKNGKTRAMKGNCAIYINYPRNPQKDSLFQYLRMKKSHPSKKLTRPAWSIRCEGGIIDPNKKVWYPVSENLYRKKKESILKKYDGSQKENQEESLTPRQKTLIIQREKLGLPPGEGIPEISIGPPVIPGIVERGRGLVERIGPGVKAVLEEGPFIGVGPIGFGIPSLPTREEIAPVAELVGEARLRGGEFATRQFEKQFGALAPQVRERVTETAKQEAEFLRGAVEEVLATPRERPFETAAFIVAPQVITELGALAKFVPGRALVSAAKAGVVGPTTTKALVTAGRGIATGAKVGIGATFVGMKGFELVTAPTEFERGRVFGRTATELAAFGLGIKETRPRRITERFKAEVAGPLEAAQVAEPPKIGEFEFKSRAEFIGFAQQAGRLGLRGLDVLRPLQPLRPVPFERVSGITPREAGSLEQFFAAPGRRFVKGSVPQTTFFKPQRVERFLEVRGTKGRFKDIDVAVETEIIKTERETFAFGLLQRDVPIPLQPLQQGRFKVDIKAFKEQVKAVGGRPRKVAPGGARVQAIEEQFFTKSTAAFERRPLEESVRRFRDISKRFEETGQLPKEFPTLKAAKQELLEPGFFRLEKDIRDVLFISGEAAERGLLKPSEFKFVREAFPKARGAPTLEPVASSRPPPSPRFLPSGLPSVTPSLPPSVSPGVSPSPLPSAAPSLVPSISAAPSVSPAISPRALPSISPAVSRSVFPSVSPSVSPSISVSPSFAPSPSLVPSPSISARPSIVGPPPLILLPKLRQRKVKEKPKKRGRGFLPSPTLVALEFDIVGAPQIKTTGFEIRPIPLL